MFDCDDILDAMDREIEKARRAGEFLSYGDFHYVDGRLCRVSTKGEGNATRIRRWIDAAEYVGIELRLGDFNRIDGEWTIDGMHPNDWLAAHVAA